MAKWLNRIGGSLLAIVAIVENLRYWGIRDGILSVVFSLGLLATLWFPQPMARLWMKRSNLQEDRFDPEREAWIPCLISWVLLGFLAIAPRIIAS